MKRSGDIRWGELRLGLLIFVALALFLWASIQGGTNLFKKTYTLHSTFPNVQGVVSGAPIWFQGVEVGTVKSLDFARSGDSSHVAVTLTVGERVWPFIRRDSRVRIQALNVFGEKFMEVTPGDSRAPAVRNGDTLRSEPPTDLAEVLARGQKIVEMLDSTMTELNVAVKRIRRGEGTLGRLTASDELYTSLNSTVRQVQSLALHVDESQTAMRRSLVSVATTLDTLGKRIERGEGSLGLLAKDPALYRNLSGATARLDTTLARIERGEGNLGKLSRDEALYRNLEQSLGRLDKLMADIQANPSRYFKFSVF
ncbi:MAG: MlaD family protein [Candidatus Eiseniibacteriota bacterium]